MTDKWRWTALIVYLVICVYDFMVVPIYYGIARMGLDLADYMSHLQEIEDPLVQMEYLKKTCITTRTIYIEGRWTVSFILWCNTYR